MTTFVILGSGLAVIALLVALLVRTNHRARKTEAAPSDLERRFRPILDLEAERQRVAAQIAEEKAAAAREVADESAALARARQNLEAERQRIDSQIAEAKLAASRAVADEKAAADRVRQELEVQRLSIVNEMRAMQDQLVELRATIVSTDELATLQSFGVYKKHYDFPTSAEFDRKIAEFEVAQQTMIKNGSAGICTVNWVVEGSEKKGAQFAKRSLAMMLRAFNGECDAAVARVKYNNVQMMEERIAKSATAINRLGAINKCEITREYIRLRLDELRAVHEQREKIQAEKEEQRAIRERIREEEIALREMEKARQDAERDEERYETALVKARLEVESAQGAKHDKLLAKIAEMERALAEAHENKERAISRAQQTRSGHVYVISNVGSFGEHVYKIGMTRRLDPMERIRELGDASVPFAFDVHAVIYSDDAPALESELHRVFGDRRLNLVNERKEFFHVGIEEVAREVRARRGDILITLAAEAEEYRKTVAILADRGGPSRGWGTYDPRSGSHSTAHQTVA
jgi:hypothetical protein